MSAADIDPDPPRAIVSEYKDVEAALAGRHRTPDNHGVSAAGDSLAPELGAMGIHCIDPALPGITGTAPRVDGQSTFTGWKRPSILICEPQADGSLELVAVEKLLFEAAWNASGFTRDRMS